MSKYQHGENKFCTLLAAAITLESVEPKLNSKHHSFWARFEVRSPHGVGRRGCFAVAGIRNLIVPKAKIQKEIIQTLKWRGHDWEKK